MNTDMTLFEHDVQKILLFFPDPINQPNKFDDAKDIYIIHYKRVRTLVNTSLKRLRKLLTSYTNINILMLKRLLKNWNYLSVVSNFYLRRFKSSQIGSSSSLYSTKEEMQAFLDLNTNIHFSKK